MSVEEIVGKMFVDHAQAGIEIKPSCILQLAEEHPEHTANLKLFAEFYGRYKAASEDFQKTKSTLTNILLRLADAHLSDNLNKDATEAADETDEKS